MLPRRLACVRSGAGSAPAPQLVADVKGDIEEGLSYERRLAARAARAEIACFEPGDLAERVSSQPIAGLIDVAAAPMSARRLVIKIHLADAGGQTVIIIFIFDLGRLLAVDRQLAEPEVGGCRSRLPESAS